MKTHYCVSSLLLCCLLTTPRAARAQQSRHTVSGYVREAGSGESLVGVNVYLPDRQTGTVTNVYGFYSLTLPAADSVTVNFSYVGYQPQRHALPLQRDHTLDVSLASQQLDEVVVEAERNAPRASERVQMSTVEVPVRQVQQIPALLGEKDVLKVLQLMPGVQSGSEGNSGLYVRGGGPDQNLIILDDAIVYNAYHLFGFFSLFNGDALKSVELTKGGFPARHGGRLSSVLEMTMKDGNREAYHGEVGVGIISSRATFEGPIVKNKSSFLISGRRTYADLLVRPFIPEGDGGYYFWDLNGKANYDFGRRDKVYLSGYFGRDRFFFVEREEEDERFRSGLNWGNATATARWNHLFNDQLFANTSLIFSNYRFGIFQEDRYRVDGELQDYELRYFSGVRDWSLKHDLFYVPNPRHTVRAGVLTTAHRFTPSAVVERADELGIDERAVNAIDAVESGVYVEDTWRPAPRWLLNGGLRLSHFYTDGRHYLNPEPRASVAYRWRDDLSLKASFATMNQYIHLLTNTGIGLPTDLWVPSTSRVRPQQSRQVAAGVAKDFIDRNLTLTVEGYYKKMDDILNYREGASFLLVDGPEGAQEVSWEDNVTAGQGWSYGAEVLLQRKVGKFSGWVGYTLSWTQLQFDELNDGEKFWARFDRRHDISVVGIYQPNERVTLSGTWVYGTGNAVTLPLGEYQAPEHQPGVPFDFSPRRGRYFFGADYEDYGERNAFRMAPYHRLDLGVQFHKPVRWGERTWELSVYNAYARQNPFFYFLGQDYNTGNDTYRTTLRQITLFPFIPSVSYQLKF